MDNQTNITQPTTPLVQNPVDSQEKQQTSYELVFTDPANNIENRFPIEDGKEISIGAGYENDVLVEDEYMSAKHFKLNCYGDKIFVQDNQSKNGLFIKLDLDPFELLPDQTLLAGKTKFKVETKQQ